MAYLSADLQNHATAFLMAQLQPPNFPTPLGVFRNVEKPSYEERVISHSRRRSNVRWAAGSAGARADCFDR